MFLRKFSFFPVSPSLHYEEKESVKKEGFPPRVVSITNELVCTNSESYRSSFPEFDPDQLEKDISIGKDLKEVNPIVFDKQFIDREEVLALDLELTNSNN